MSKNSDKKPRLGASFVREAAAQAGFSLCGIAPYRVLEEEVPRLGRWVGDGLHGGLGYMEREPSRRCDPSFVFPRTRSVVVCAANYRNSAWDISDDGRPKIASYAYSKDYHGTVKGMLLDVLSRIRTNYPEIKGRAVTDTAPILEKAWAVEAGLGWIGRNSLLVTPRYGSAVLLGELLIDAPVDSYDTPLHRDGCGDCRRCADSCPAGAINPDRTINASKCFSRLTVEPGADRIYGTLPSASGFPFDGWVFGCDACQRCCPHNRGREYTCIPGFMPVIDPSAFDRSFCRSLGFGTFCDMFCDTPLERPGLEKIYPRIKAVCGSDR